jgi:hypothetical protein
MLPWVYQSKVYNKLFLKFRDKRTTKKNKKRMSSLKEEKKHYTFLFSNSISSSFFLFILDDLKNYGWYIWGLLKTLWNVKDNATMTKEIELQNSNCSYVFKSKFNTFHFQRAYFAYFKINFCDVLQFCLDGLSKGLQNLFQL